MHHSKLNKMIPLQVAKIMGSPTERGALPSVEPYQARSVELYVVLNVALQL